MFDVIIIGSGTAGLCAAYELNKLDSTLKILVLEKGHSIENRKCPIIEGKVNQCIHCTSCSIMSGLGGAGAFSDGKFNFTTEFGGWLADYIDPREVLDLIDYVDQINMRFGATSERFSTQTPEAQMIQKKALEYDLHLLQAECKHLGTENNLNILTSLYNYLSDKVTFKFDTEVKTVNQVDDQWEVVTKDQTYSSRYLIVGPGRSGSEWFTGICHHLGIDTINNQVDIGVRVELPALVFKHITDVVYESKLVYRTRCYGDNIRTFCMNPYGQVVAENVDGIITVNGHSYADPKLQSENTNFALLVSSLFTEPFNEPHQYGKHIAALSNMLGGGVIVQRYGDLISGRRTNIDRLMKSTVRPTLKATPGDLSLVIPKRQLDDIIEMLQALNNIAPGTTNVDTLLYGVETKFYSSRIKLDSNLETELPNLYAVGDGAGITRGLSQAGASGIRAARAIIEKLRKPV